MTKEQSDQFDDFGCASRCLLALANAAGSQWTKETYIDRYAEKYWPPGSRCGMLGTADEIIEMAVELGIASSGRKTEDFAEARKQIKEAALGGLLLVTRKKREEDGTLSIYNHCTLLNHQRAIDGHLILLQVDYTTGEQKALVLPDASLVPLIPSFVLLLREKDQERPES